MLANHYQYRPSCIHSLFQNIHIFEFDASRLCSDEETAKRSELRYEVFVSSGEHRIGKMSQTGYAAYSLSIPIHRTHRDTMHMIKYSLHVCDEQGKVLALKKSHIFFRSVEDEEAQSADQNNRIQLSICNKEGGVAKRKPTGNTKKSTLFFGHQHGVASYGSEEDDSSEEDEDDEGDEDEDANEGEGDEDEDANEGEGVDEDGEASGEDEDANEGEGADEDGEASGEDANNEELEGTGGEAEDTILHNMYVSACKEPLSNDEAAEHIGCLPDEE